MDDPYGFRASPEKVAHSFKDIFTTFYTLYNCPVINCLEDVQTLMPVRYLRT